MLQNYFIYNGTRYHTGQMLIMNDMGKHKKATFLYYDTEYDSYVYQIKECRHHDPESFFYKNLIEVLNEKNPNAHLPVLKKRKDLEIDGLFIGWVWYIFIMVIGVIFKDCLGIWALASFIFFKWRKEKINKEGYYYER